jgi:tRNA pseudouridine38-40 synthase
VTRFKLTVEYDGGPFVGWQRQANGLSIQQALEEALARITGETTDVQGAGRTDAGVHAMGQVAHVDIEKEMTSDKLRDALNFHLKPAPIAVLAAEIVAPDFHARFSATGRAYLYRIVNRRAPAPRSMPRQCTTPHRCWSARTISPPSGRRSASRNRR